MSYERDIMEAMAGGDPDKAEARITVRMVVQRYITCRWNPCSRVMDVKDALVVESPDEKPLVVGCGRCAPTARKALEDAAKRAQGKVPAGELFARILTTNDGIERVLVPEE